VVSSQDGRVVGRYREFELLEEIGQGSFARVYKVKAPGHKRPLALKLATDTRLSEDTIKRAIREVAILRTLTNPHVAKMHGSSVGPDHFYVLMDYLEGLQLNQYHDFDEPMQAARALEIMLQVCMGLAEAHAQGVVHRDIKPANIWITPGGLVKLLDFGLARAWGVPWAFGTNATAARTVVGTPHYCQPEQVHTDELTPASDVYSLATILYELLSGRSVLFEDRPVSEVVEMLNESPVAWLDAHVMQEMVPIRRYPECAWLPDSLLQLLWLALSKDPEHRPQSAGEMASALGKILVEDFGAMTAGRVRVIGEGPDPLDVPLLPGRRTLGCSPFADVRVPGGSVMPVHAIIDWSGGSRPIQVRPADGATLLRNGEPMRKVIDAEPGDVFALDEAYFVLSRPEGT
jgi:serine/threonine-protein kinase